ncbi:MAG: hypothetical protein LBE31_08510 [Deltaproteobacteria bacterium]|jgi:intracellular multiplication protein IcmB|nr:hypothetical protein [Deltaproteobacteria bacterium]
MSLFSLFNRASHTLWSLLKAPADSYCRLETADDDLTLVADDGSLISAVRVYGAYFPVDSNRLDQMVAILTEKTSVLFEKPGHFLQMVFDYDPQGAKSEIEGYFRPSRVTAKECQLNLDEVIGDWEKTIASYCGSEKFTIVFWTTPKFLPEANRNHEAHITAEGLPKVIGRQTEGRAVAALRHAHLGARDVIGGALTAAGLAHSNIEVHEIIRDIKLSLDPSQTPKDFRAVLPGDSRPMTHLDSDSDPRSMILLPSIGSQIFSREAQIVDRDMIRVGERLHAPFVMALPPMTPKPFSELMRVLNTNNPTDPLRISINISPDGFDGLGVKAAMAGILGFSSADNRKITAAISHLRELAQSGQTIIGLSISFETFCDISMFESLSEAISFLKSRRSRLAQKVCGWGQGKIGEVVGDPLLGVCAVMPALMPHGGPAPRAAAPLSAAWFFMPIRPASPFTRGSLVLRTPDGKTMPFAPMSSVQSAWIDLALAPMGGGKSVLLNTLNLAFCLQSGLRDLPWLSIIDVGPSSGGLISLLKASLPKDLKHLAVSHRLTMDPKSSVNPFDTPLGCREPLSVHLAFLVNLLCLLCTPLDAMAPPAGVEGIVRQATIASYRELNDKPKLISQNLEPDLVNSALDLGFILDAQSSWWELTDFFASIGLDHKAHLAQRHAVPTLVDVSAQVRQHPGLRATYGFSVQGTQENILDFVWRQLTESVASYRCLAGPTKFSLGDARIICLDLDEVATRGGGAAGDRRTAVMYMLARYLAGNRFFLTPSALSEIPAAYQSYHQDRITKIRRDPKRLCYDELHRVSSLSALQNQLIADLETSARESRKWNLSLGLCSQTWSDFPKVIVELATSVFILGSGTERGRKELSELFGLEKVLETALERLGKPGAKGADLVALFRASDGTTRHLLTNTVSPNLLWAFSSTSEDMTVREALYERFGVEKTLKVLSERYPYGLKAEAERLKELRRVSSPFEVSLDVLTELTEKLAQIIDGPGNFPKR